MMTMIEQAMIDHDDWVIEMQYTNKKGETATRIVSPIRYMGSDRFMALCLCREEPRVFQISQCSNIALRPAWDYVMPVTMA